MFLLVPAYPGCPESKAVKRSLLLLFSRKPAALRFMSAFVCKAFSILTPCLFPRPYLSEQQERHKYGMGKLFQATLSRGHISFHTNKLSIIVTMEVRTYKFVTSV